MHNEIPREKARQARTRTGLRYVLVVSLVLAVVTLLVAFFAVS